MLHDPIHTTHRVKPITLCAVGRSTPGEYCHCHLQILPISSDECNQALIYSECVDNWPGLDTKHFMTNEFSKVYCCHGDGFSKSQKAVDIYIDTHADRLSRVSAHVTRAKLYPESSSRNFFDNDHNLASPVSKRRWLPLADATLILNFPPSHLALSPLCHSELNFSRQESSISRKPPPTGISEVASNLLRHGDSALDHIHDYPADNGWSPRKRRVDEEHRNPKRRRKLQKGSIPDIDHLPLQS